MTRKSVLELAKDLGIQVETRQLSVSELVDASKNNTLKEIFGSGTAVVVLPIHGFGYKGEDFQLPKSEDSLALKLKSNLTYIQYNRTDDPYGWRVKV